MLKLIKLFKPYILSLIALVGLVYVQVWATLKLPDYTAKIVNEGIVEENTQLIIHTGLIMLLVSLIGGVAMIIVSYLASKIAAGYTKNLREKLFSKVESFSLTEFNKFSTASLITRSTNDIQQIQTVLIMLLRLGLMAPIMGVGAVINAYALAPHMTWLMAVAVGAIFVIITILFTIALPKFKQLQKMVDQLNLITRQILTGLRVIRAFNTEKSEESKFDDANTKLTALNLFVNRLMVIMQPIMMLIFNFTALATIWVGAHLIDSGDLAIGNMMAFLQYSMQVIMSFLFLSIIFILVPRASVSIDRISEVIATEPSIKDPIKSKKITNGIGKIEFKNVYFSYPGADIPVLEDISFDAIPGQTTAFVGSTGSGKSSIINLIPRFYDVISGEILIDNINIKDITQDELWHKIGYVPQKGVLFSGTIESNIKYGAPNATDDEVSRAAKIAQATEFINTFPEKYRTPISQGGTNISGGQKQRLSIARAIIRKPEIYIFDDSFSSLDFKTDSLLRNSLKSETKNKTVLIVAQRISTIMDAQKIIVLDQGKIVGQGSHNELMKNCQVYNEIALSQLSEDELRIDKRNTNAKLSMRESI
jgi:ATP-binding cassette subfamily B protein